MESYDVIVIGGGAAGLSAALVLTRARRAVAVVDSGRPRNRPASNMHGFISRDGMPPGELLEVGRTEVTSYGGTILAGVVTTTARDGRLLDVVLDDGRELSGRRVLIATGLADELPDVAGLRERWALDVLHCPYCHGYEVRDRKLAVLGGSAPSVAYAQIVRQWSADLAFVSPDGFLGPVDRERLKARGIAVVEGAARRLLLDGDRLAGVELDDGRAVVCEALFVPPTFIAHSALLRELGCELDPHGWPVADATGRTTAPGVWVAGNVVNPRAQVITAAGEGSAAAIAINADLVEEDVREAVADRRRRELPPPTTSKTDKEE